MKRIIAMGVALWSALVMGVAADDLTLLPAGAGGKYRVPTNSAVDGSWTVPAFDDSGWSNVIGPVGFDRPNAPIAAGGVIADSVLEFSGTQGGSNWYYGYWDKRTDPDGTYQAWEFTAFPRETGNNVPGANNFWNGSKWDWFNGDPPWSELTATGGHPNHPNGGAGPANAHHYVIRRWISEVNGPVHLVGSVSDGGECGDGVDLRVWVDGVEVLGLANVFGTNAPFAVNVEVQIGSTVDFAVGPNTANDSCDGFGFNVKVLQNTLADSVEDFSGQQGARGWTYGYYNKTADANATYNAATDFNSTDPNLTFIGAWVLGPGDPPWTSIGPSEMRPHSGPEHWAIRRYTSTYAGRVRIAGTLSIFQPCNGGTRARIYVDGIQVFNRDLSQISLGYSVVVNVSVGSRIDFALDPNGDDGCDDTTWTATIQPASVSAMLIADSAAEFSGVQGQDNWHYGFYNKSGDGSGAYDPATDFNTTDPNWGYVGAWVLGEGGDPNANPPWDTLGAINVHPNGINSGGEHWVIRRWVSEVTGAITVDWHFAKEDADGDGASLLVFHNGARVDAASVAGTDRLGVLRTLALHVQAGDRIDFALTPLGPEGDTGDGADGSFFNARLYAHGYNPGAVCAPLADSQADWSAAGEQGHRGWTYGYYNKTADAVPGYQPGDFTAFPAVFPRPIANPSSTDYWDGTRWRWQPPLVPWDTIGQTEVHPNGMNNGAEHWVIRRWISPYAGALRVDWFTRTVNPFGNGVTGRILHNGTEKEALSIAGADTIGVARSLTLASVNIGDTIDLALTPVGPGGAADDGADNSANGMTLYICTNVADFVTTDVVGRMKDVNSSAYLRLLFNSPEPACLDQLRLRMKYDDGFAAYLNGVEVARRNASPPLAWNSRATAARSTAQVLADEVIDISAFKTALLPGGNVLAVHGLNWCVDDADFLLAPEITATILPPEILFQPSSRTNLLGETAEFSVTARSCAAAAYQWRSNGVPVPGATAGTIFIAAQPAHQAGYDVIVSNGAGSITSVVAALTVNRPPVALDNGVSTSMNASILLPARKLLNNDSDPDGDPIAVLSVASPTLHGGSALLAMGNIMYSPPAGFTGADSFEYTINDGRGGTAAAVVQVFVYSGALPSGNQVNFRPTAQGYKVTFAGIPGEQYFVQRATNLNPPVAWTTLQTLIAPVHGIMEYEDVTSLPSAFYRTTAAP